jgi:hypothetical protein
MGCDVLKTSPIGHARPGRLGQGQQLLAERLSIPLREGDRCAVVNDAYGLDLQVKSEILVGRLQEDVAGRHVDSLR